MPAQRWRLLLVDDHALFREGLAGLFAYQSDFEVVGQAGDGAAALDQVRQSRPAMVLVDIDLPGSDGIAVTRELKAEFPDLMVVMLTVHDATDKLIDAIKAGAQGYVVKSIRSAELLDQLRGLTRGEAAVTRRMAARILEEFRRVPSVPAEGGEPEQEITNRELEVLELVADRLSNKEVAARLVISEHTVKNHIKNILGKLHLRSRRQAAEYGAARGWLRPGDSTQPRRLG
jgi:two-component system, NarL family, nitrate/nitrite response regulator NarL